MRSVVLSGFMATGKSTVGKLVAERLGLPFVDTDESIAASSGRSVAELFAAEGEARFREREAEIATPLLTDGVARVIAFGGGTVTIPRIRHLALEAASVVTLTASAETIATRAAGAGIGGRPNLGAVAPLDRARDLLALRREAYGECHLAVSTEGTTPAAIAERVAAFATRDAIAVPLGTRSYCVELSDGEPARLTETLRALAPSSLVVVSDENVVAARGGWLDRALAPLALREVRIVIPPGEPSKTLATVARIWDEALGAGCDRQTVVVAFGGGVVGDLAAFCASTLLRGVRCVQIPTSLLAMVDSSVGGKTGFDHPAGKNLLGAFFQPSHVLIDLEHLTTLPERERAAGLAEVLKIALVRDPGLHALVLHTAARLAHGDRASLREVIRLAVIAKMRVVREDEHETGVRALLNLGHTVGHALETHGGYSRWLHGEAVAIGTVLELAATERLGLTPPGTSLAAADLLTMLGLPTTVPMSDVAAAFPHVKADKKRAGDGVKLPVVTGVGEGRVERVSLADLARALGL